MLEHRPHPQRLGPNMDQLRQPKKKIVSIKLAADGDGVDVFDEAGVAAE